jgi:hypothetical protein
MNNSLQQHGAREVTKQLRFRMKHSGLETIEINITRKCGKHVFGFTGSPEEVVKAEKILADWP